MTGYTSNSWMDLTGCEITIGKTLYHIRELVGAGGFSAVYAARDNGDRDVAVKATEISGNVEGAATATRAYLNEVRHLKRLRRLTRHVVKIFDFDFHHGVGVAFIVMERADGTLADLLNQLHIDNRARSASGHFIPAAYRKQIWRQLVTVVSSLHKNNTVHLDLEPGNFLLFGHRLKVGDFGISKNISALGFSVGQLGTPYYSAPEVFLGQYGAHQTYGPEADVWSLGAILYLMTYGAPPTYGPLEFRNAPPPPTPPFGQTVTRDRSLVDLLNRTLVLDPWNRISTSEVRRHPYSRH